MFKPCVATPDYGTRRDEGGRSWVTAFQGSDVKFRGIHHLAMVTGDMDRTIRFWRDLLGMRLVAGMGKTGYRQYFFELSGGTLMGFYEWTGAEPVSEKEAGQAMRGPIVFDHLCMEVESEDALWDLKERLDAGDIWVSEVIDHGFIHSIFTFDPNGIALEFSCAVAGYDFRRHPVMIDREPSEITKEGPEPQQDVWPEPTARTSRAERRMYAGELRKLIASWPASGNAEDTPK
ncbi:MAG TPA: VOC family protein [Dissulfurispiraceae bacterium]|nr:VOC family protein [Dissulfurispiraceae bacterium]